MHTKLRDALDSFLKAKGYVHEEEHIVEQYNCTQQQLDLVHKIGGAYSKPKQDPDGEAVYTRIGNVSIVDDLPKDEVELLLSINQESYLESISESLKKNQETLDRNMSIMENHLKIIKGCIIFFTALTVLNIALSLIL